LNPAAIQQAVMRRRAMAGMPGMPGGGMPGGGMPMPGTLGPMTPGAGMPAPGAPPMAPPPALSAGMARGGEVRQDGDTEAKKLRPDRQWGDISRTAEDVPEPIKKAKGGVLKRKPPKVKVARIPKKDKPVSTPNPYDYEDDEGTAPPVVGGGPASLPAAAAAPPPPPPGPPGMKKGGKWIADAIKKPGALHKDLHVPKNKTIPEGKLAKAAKKKGKVGERARLAEKLEAMRKNKGGKCEAEKMAAGGVAKVRRGFPDVSVKKAPQHDRVSAVSKGEVKGGKAGARRGIAKKGDRFQGTYAKGGKVRGCGIATKGCNFSGIY